MPKWQAHSALLCVCVYVSAAFAWGRGSRTITMWTRIHKPAQTHTDTHTEGAPQLADRQTIATAHLCMCVCVRVRLPVCVYYIAA